MPYTDQYNMLIENFIDVSLMKKVANEPEDHEYTYATEFLKTLYENVVYNENIEMDENDKCSKMFADKIISMNKESVKKILENTGARFTKNSKLETIKEEARTSALSMIKIMFEDSSLQINEIEMLSEDVNNTPERIASLSSLFNEYKELSECKAKEDGSLKSMLLSTMTESDQLRLALRIDTFKNILSSAGIDMSKSVNKDFVNCEFEKNLF